MSAISTLTVPKVPPPPGAALSPRPRTQTRTCPLGIATCSCVDAPTSWAPMGTPALPPQAWLAEHHPHPLASAQAHNLGMTQNPVFLSHPTSNLKASPVSSGSRTRALSALLATPRPHPWSSLNTDQLASSPPPTGYYSQHGRQSGPLRRGSDHVASLLETLPRPPILFRERAGVLQVLGPGAVTTLCPSVASAPATPARCALPGLLGLLQEFQTLARLGLWGFESAAPSAQDALPPAVCMANSLHRKVFVQMSPSQWDKLSALWRTAGFSAVHVCPRRYAPATFPMSPTYYVRVRLLLPLSECKLQTHRDLSVLSTDKSRVSGTRWSRAIAEARRARAESTRDFQLASQCWAMLQPVLM